MALTDFVPERGGVKWMTIFEHSFQTASNRRPEREYVKCCACRTRIPYTESWVCVAYGTHGNRLPLPSFIHCSICAMKLDPQTAYTVAFAKDAKAGLPDPEKIQRELELNEKMAQIPGLENQVYNWPEDDD